MTEVRSTLPVAGSWRQLGVVSVALLTVAVACSSGDDGGTATAAPTEPAGTETPVDGVATEAPAVDASADGDTEGEPSADVAATDAAGPALDFGSGVGSITLGEETFEFAIGPGAGLCRDVFGIIQAGGSVADGRDIEARFMIPPLDWETFTDGRYDPPSVSLEISTTGDDNASWRADAAWAQENDKVGMSQVDSYEKDGQTASGSVTFANAWNPDDASIQGSFEIDCAEG